MGEMSDGQMTYKHSYATLALTVRQGVIVACDPPREWPLGQSAMEVWHRSQSYGADLEWTPEEEKASS